MLDLKAVESFLIASQTLSFTETAKRQSTVQSAISSQITKLELKLGHRLFERRRGAKMSLTPEGRIFASQAIRLLNTADEAVDAVRQTDRRSTIRLGTTSTVASTILPEALRQFSQDNSRVRFEISCDRSTHIMNAYERGDLDIALVIDQGRTHGRLFVQDVPLGWLASKDFDPEGHESLPLVFLSDGRDLRTFAIAALDRGARAHHIAHLSSDPAGVRAIVSAGIAMTVSPCFAATDSLFLLKESKALPHPGRVPFSCYASQKTGREDILEFCDTLLALLQRTTRN